MKVFEAQVEALVPGGNPFDFALPEFPRLRFCLNCAPPDAILIARDAESGDIVPPPPVEAVLSAMRYVRSPAWAERRGFAMPVCVQPPMIGLARDDSDIVPGSTLYVVTGGEWEYPAEMHPDEFPVERYWAADGMPLGEGADDDRYVLGEEDIGLRIFVVEQVLDETARSNVIGPIGARV